MKKFGIAVASSFVLAWGCGAPSSSTEIVDGDSQAVIAENTWDAMGLLAVVNRLTAAQLTNNVGLNESAANSIRAYRLGDDAILATADDSVIDSLAELDSIPFVTSSEVGLLLSYAQTRGYVDAFKNAIPYTPGAVVAIEGKGNRTHHTQYWTASGNCVMQNTDSPFNASATFRLTPVLSSDGALMHHVDVVSIALPWLTADEQGNVTKDTTFGVGGVLESTTSTIAYDVPWTIRNKTIYTPRTVTVTLTASGLRLQGTFLNDMNAGSCSGAGSDYLSIDLTTGWPAGFGGEVVLPPEPEVPTEPPTPAVLTAADLTSGDLVITEFMANPSLCPDASGEWFEVYNASGAPILLDGLIVENASGTASEVSSTKTLAPSAYAVLGRGTATTFCGAIEPDGVYGSKFYLSNTKDSISILAKGSEQLIDSTGLYTKSFAKAGRSVALVGAPSAATNDTIESFVLTTSTIGSTSETGTPGSE